MPEFPLAEIYHPNADSPSWRKNVEPSLSFLEGSIREQGLVNPLIVRYRPDCGDSAPLICVGAVRLVVLREKLGWTHAPVLVCGRKGKDYGGAQQFDWSDPELHLLFRDGTLGVDATNLVMAQCTNRSKSERPGIDRGTYIERRIFPDGHVETKAERAKLLKELEHGQE